MDAECTHEENVVEIVIQREIKEKNVWQADLLQGISLKKELRRETGGKGNEMGRQRRDRQTQDSSAMQHSSSLPSASLPVWENTALSVYSMLSEKPPLSPLQHGSAYLSVMRDTL